MARLVGSFLTVSVLTVVFVALVAFSEARHALREAIADRLETVALQKEGELNRWVDLQRELIVFLADLPQMRHDAALLAEDGSHEARARIGEHCCSRPSVLAPTSKRCACSRQ